MKKLITIIVLTFSFLLLHAQKEIIQPDSNKIEDNWLGSVVEQMPMPPYDVQKYIESHLQYSELMDNTRGRVIIGFLVEIDGSIKDVKVVKFLSQACDKEAIRVVSGMPKWKPGMQNGKPVRVYYTVPVNIRPQ